MFATTIVMTCPSCSADDEIVDLIEISARTMLCPCCGYREER
ncbi:hypothetical protein OG984_02800 [Nocardioides sp. NBC_00368]